eukprot:gene8283-8470_t
MLTASLTAAGANRADKPHLSHLSELPPATTISGSSSSATEPEITEQHVLSETSAGVAPDMQSSSNTRTTAGGLVPSLQLPQNLLGWASWVPPDAVMSAMLTAAQQHCSRSLAAVEPPKQPGTSSFGNSNWSFALSRSAVLVPELLLAHLQWLAEQMAQAGHLVASLPVLHLARLVALVVLESQVMAAAMTLRLASACEALGLWAEAAAWLALAAPDAWPTQEQLVEVAQQTELRHLVTQVLQQSDTVAPRLDANPGLQAADSAGGSAPALQILGAALQQADPAVWQYWLRPKGFHTVHDPAGVPSSSRSIMSAGGSPATKKSLENVVAASARRSRHLKPLALQDALLGIAKYQVDHAQYTRGVRVCKAAIDIAR